MTPRNQIAAGLAASILTTVLLLGYLAGTLHEANAAANHAPTAHGPAARPSPIAPAPSARPVPAPAPVPTPAPMDSTAAQVAPWISPPDAPEKQPVPAEVLYCESNPAPPFQVKAQSWHNWLLFRAVHCPYCGRRVPTKSGRYIYLVIGLVGQLIFSMRFLVQWIASEKAKASVIPVAFWYLSMAGSLLLLIYATSIMAVPIILGHAPNLFIYGRNLYFIKKMKEKEEREAARADAERAEMEPAGTARDGTPEGPANSGTAREAGEDGA